MAVVPTTGEAQVPAGFAELGSAAIRRALSGIHVTPDPNVRQLVVPYGESFHPDGSWISSRQERGPLIMEGRWKVRDGKVCVTVERITRESSRQPRQDCRKVWRNARTGQLMMAARDTPAQPLFLETRPARRIGQP